MRPLYLIVFGIVLLVSAASAQSSAKTFDIYVVDIEDGHAVLYVAPTGESLLEDTGNPDTRDVDRIMEVINAAGVKQIDHLIITHHHGKSEKICASRSVNEAESMPPREEPESNVNGNRFSTAIRRRGRRAKSQATCSSLTDKWIARMTGRSCIDAFGALPHARRFSGHPQLAVT